MIFGTALFLSSALLLLSCVSLWLRIRTLGLADMFLLAIAMFLGAYTVIDVLTLPPPDNMDTVTVIYVLFTAGIGALIVWAFAHLGSRRLLQEVSLARLTLDWERCHSFALLLGIAPAVLYAVATYHFFGPYAGLGFGELMELEQYLPYWYTSLGMVATMLLAAVAPALWWRVVKTRGLARLTWLAMTLASIVMIFGTGRRQMFAFLVVVAATTIARMRRPRRAAFIAALVLAPTFLIVSNLYQSYRDGAYRLAALSVDTEELSEAALEADKTVENLQIRRAMWRFNYEVMQVQDPDFQWGRLLIGGLPNYIPAALYPGGKEIFSSEAELLHAFRLEQADRGENLFALTYGDFGFFGIFVAPAIMLLLVWAFGAIQRRLKDPFLRLVLMGSAINYALNFETNYTGFVPVLRSFLVIALVYIVARAAWRTWAGVLRAATQGPHELDRP